MANPQEELKLAQYLIDRVCSRASGRTERECLYNYPKDVYFIGNLRPKSDDALDSGQPSYLRDLLTKLAPVALGAEFRLERNSAIIVDVHLTWSCYYRVFPLYDQQLEHQNLQNDVKNNASPEDTDNPDERSLSPSSSEDLNEESEDILLQDQEDSEAESESPEVAYSAQDRHRGRVPRDTLFIRFKKIKCEAQGRIILQKNPNNIWEQDLNELWTALDREIARAQQVALNDPEHIRTLSSPDEHLQVPRIVLDSENTFNTFLQSLRTEIVPQWEWETIIEIREVRCAPFFDPV